MGQYMVHPPSMTVPNGGTGYLLDQSHSEYSLPAFFPAAPASGEDDLQLNFYWSHCELYALYMPQKVELLHCLILYIDI